MNRNKTFHHRDTELKNREKGQNAMFISMMIGDLPEFSCFLCVSVPLWLTNCRFLKG